MSVMKRGVLGTAMQRAHAPEPEPRGPSEDDKATPPCKFCGEPHIGVHTSAFLMLRGAWVVSPALGHEIFVLDPDINLVQLDLPNRQIAIVTDMNRPAIAAATHEDCVERVLLDVGLAESEEEEEAFDELDDGDEDAYEEDL